MQYSTLEIQETKWFAMTVQQRQKHIMAFNRAKVVSTVHHLHDLSTSSLENKNTCSTSLSVSCEDFSKDVIVPLKCLEGIWEKATQLLNTDGAIVPAPGQKPEAQMVLSYSGKNPHMVSYIKTGDFACDANCPNWKGLGICSHSVAVAEVNGQLKKFLSSKKRRKPPNLTNMVPTSAPRSHGRKGSVPTRHRKQSEPITTRVEINISSGSYVISQSSSFDHSTSYLVPPPTYPAPMNVLQSPMYGNQSYGPFHCGYAPYYYGQSSNVCQPLLPCPPPTQQPTFTLPFSITFITGNITVCFGCKNKYYKNLQPPEDLCIKHQDWRQFTPSNGAAPQSKFGNVYYHCKPECIWLQHPTFTMKDVEIPQNTKEKLTAVHKQYLASVFGFEL